MGQGYDFFFRYDSHKGKSTLKFHLGRYHNYYWQAILGGDGREAVSSSRKRPYKDAGKPSEVALDKFSCSVKKVKTDSTKAVAFTELLTLLS